MDGLFVLRILIFSGFLTICFFSAAYAKNTELLIASAESMSKDPVFKRLVESSSQNLDKMKIQYLISRIRQSPYFFIRNGERHTGARAASHMAMKYAASGGRVKTPAEFIEYIASKSSMTGQVYYIEIDGRKVEVKKVLSAELSLLEKKLKQPSV